MADAVAWTGHRPDLFRSPAAARQAVDAIARELVQQQYAARFLVGGQRGVDTWAALAALDLGLPYRVVLPVDAATFAWDWQLEDRAGLDHILDRAEAVRIATDGRQISTEHAFSERNRLLVAEADLLVAVWTGLEGGGTAETIALARLRATPLREVVLDPSPMAGSATGRGI